MAKKSSRKPAKPLGPWRIDGISPDAVAAATEAAMREGLPLEDWLAQLIQKTAERERLERGKREPEGRSAG
jgi:hypothetical protein